MSRHSLSGKNITALMIFNILMIVLFLLAWAENLNDKDGVLTAYGFAYLKYYTVISNAIEALISAVFLIILIRIIKGRLPGIPRILVIIKYITASMLSVTFLVVVIMLAPQLGLAEVFTGANFWMHLIIPALAITEFLAFIKCSRISMKATLITLAPTVLYALVYMINISVNGRGNPPTTNDIYGILKWGLGIGVLIFIFILLINWGSACILRLTHRH